MSHLSKAIDSLPGPSSQQPHPPAPSLPQANTLPNMDAFPNPIAFPNPDTAPNPNMFPNSSTFPNPNPYNNPNTLPNPNTSSNPNTLPNPNTLHIPSNVPNTVSNPVPDTLPNPVPDPPPNPNTLPDPLPSNPNTVPNPSTLPSPDVLPNPNLSLAGKLAGNIRRSKRQKTMDTPEESASASVDFTAAVGDHSKAMSASTSDSNELSDCPKEYLIENAYTDRLRFNNEIARILYNEDFPRLGSKEKFQKYLSGQQKWRWEINSIVTTLDTRVHNLVANKNAGIAQNVMRYSTVPLNCKSDDVRRCEKTAKELEKMVQRIDQTRSDMMMRKKLLFDEEPQPVEGEVAFLDTMIGKLTLLKDNVESCLTKVQDTLQSICRRFTTESVEAAEIRRQKRRKKENLKKKRKSQERQLEKKVIDTLLRLTNKEVAERILTGGNANKISAEEINSKELKQMSSETEIVALHTIVVREYLEEDALKLIKNKLGKS